MTADTFINNFEGMKVPILGVRLPEFVVNDKYKKDLNVKSDTNNFDFLRALCTKGFKNLGFDKKSPEYEQYGNRIKTELETIKELGFVDYILLVWDVINFCQEEKIPTGLGRGSAAGSLVLFLIGVTKINPIKYGLYFERFISKTRAKKKVVDGITYLDGSLMCDIDLDICYYNRSKVLKYLEDKFQGKTSKILTFNTLSAKLLIKEVGKIYGGKSEEEMTRISGLIPKFHGIVEDLDIACETVEELKIWCNENKTVYDIAWKLKDLIKNKGVHASGIVITYSPLDDCCPTELSSDKDIVSSYDMDWVSLFTVKLDVLGLRGVSVVDDVMKALKITDKDINLEDPSIYRNLQDLKYPHGLFQIEADMAFRVTQKVKPRNLNELSGVIAVARPGAMQFIDQFALFTTSGTVDIIHPFFEDILRETGGVCLYQEQMMQMAHKIGFTLEEAEILRRIVGKKKLEEVAIWQQKIEDKVKENKLDPQISGILWKILDDSASYSFNKCLSLDTSVETSNGNKLLYEINKGDLVKSYDVKNDKDHFVEVKKIHKNNIELFEVELEDGRKITCSMQHKLMCEDKKMRALQQIILEKRRIMKSLLIKNIKSIGIKPTLDLEVNHPDHNFYAEGIVVSNSHSVSYAALSAYTIYLKFTYPIQFYLSLLKMAKNESKPIEEFSKIHKEMGHFKILLLPPSLVTSQMDFAIEETNIRFGLSSIKGISEKTIEKLNDFKRVHATKFELFESSKEAGLSIGVTSALIQAGALDKFVTQNQKGKNRSLLVYEAQLWNLLKDKERQAAKTLSKNSNDYRLAHIIKLLNTEVKDEKSKPLIKDSRMGTIKKNSDKYKLIYLQNNECQPFANWWYENNLLGYATYVKLIDIFREQKPSLIPIEQVSQLREGQNCTFVGRVEEDPKMGISKTARKSKYAKFLIGDESGIQKVMIFNDSLEECKRINDTFPKEGDIVIVTGNRKGKDTIFAHSVTAQQNKIYTKLSKLKDAKESKDKEIDSTILSQTV